MAEEIRLEREIEGFTEGAVIEWFKQVGDPVSAGDELLEIEADKANMIHQAERDGVLIGIAVQAEDPIVPGALLGWIGEPGEELPASGSSPTGSTRDEASQEAPAPQVKPAPVAVPAAAAGNGDGRIKSSPLARRVAAELGVDIGSVVGTGPNGRIVKDDVETASKSPRSAPAGVPVVSAETQRVRLSRLQTTVARRMIESKSTVPHFYLRIEVDMTAAVAARVELKRAANGGRVPSFNDFVVKAAALTLTGHPKLNGSFAGDEWVLHPQVDLGIAVATDDGLVVPVIRGADRLGLAAIGEEARRLAGAAGSNQLNPADLEGGTFTVSNLGMYGVTGFDAVVNPPQAAILSVGAIRETVIVSNGEMSPGSVLELGLSCDHRIVYGADGAAFLDDLRRRLENPVMLAL